jgi:hypothetical protein
MRTHPILIISNSLVVFRRELRLLFFGRLRFRGFAITALCSLVTRRAMVFAPGRAQLSWDPVGGLLVREIAAEACGEVVVLHRRTLMCFSRFSAEDDEVFLAHVFEVERSHGCGSVLENRMKGRCGWKRRERVVGVTTLMTLCCGVR